jgi:site-specific recombinase XerD
MLAQLVVSQENSNQNQIEILAGILNTITKQLTPKTKSLYENDVKHFSNWLETNGYHWSGITLDVVADYRNYLLTTGYAKSTASRMLAVVTRFLKEVGKRGVLDTNFVDDVRSIPANKETTHRALSKDEVNLMLGLVDITTAKGKRDYAILLTLIKTGLRRSELSALTFADMRQEQGHWILVVEHGKGDKRRIAKLPADCYRAIECYLDATNRAYLSGDNPLFVQFSMTGDKPLERGLGIKGIEYLVKGYGKKLGGSKLTPHGLRATFVTLCLEGGAPLQKVQYAAGHADPRTTERYQLRKQNLDDAAADYIKL